jgi:cell division protein FtsQ
MVEERDRRRVVALAVAIPFLLLAAGWAITYSPLFRARTIRVVGEHHLTREEIRALAGVDEGTNVFHVPAEAIVQKLKANPWVFDASVRTELPSTIVLRITERRPVGIVSGMGERSLLASDGVLLPEVGSALPDLPIVRAALGAPTGEQRVAAAAMLGALPPELLERVRETQVSQDGWVSLTLHDDIVVRAGMRGEESAKADALRAVLRWAERRDVDLRSVDVSVPTAPAGTLADGSTFVP